MIARLLVNPDLYVLDRSHGACYADAFRQERFVRFPRFFCQEGFAVLAAELSRLDGVKVRRELQMAGSGNSPRRMSTLGGLDVAHYSSIIPMLYRDPDLIAFLAGVADEPVYEVPDAVENYVCNFLHAPGDCHGAHVDAYAFAFNIIVEAPPRDAGGLLEYVPNSTALEELDQPRARRQHFEPGDCYMLRSDRAAHRVSPLAGPARRAVINMAFANADTLTAQSYSSSVLYAPAYATIPPAADRVE